MHIDVAVDLSLRWVDSLAISGVDLHLSFLSLLLMLVVNPR